jgi:signal transduction histidine kinase
MRLFSSLRSRIFLTSALLVVLTVGVAIYLVNESVTREAEDRLRREIVATGALVEQLRTNKAQTFTMMVRLIADSSMLKAAVDTNDPPTVQGIANGYQGQLNSSLLLVTNKAGQVLATVGVPTRTAVVVASQPSVREAAGGRESFSMLPQPEGMLQLVTVPILIGLQYPDIMGTLSVGFLLDDAFAGQLKRITGSEIAFGTDGQILASTLPREDRTALGELLRNVDGSRNITLRGEEYVALPLPLSSGQADVLGGGPLALILRSRTEHVRFLRTIHTELEFTAVVAIILATLLSFAVARTITRPLAAITDVMRDVAATGDLTRKIVLRGGRRWDDADARLMATTFNTLTDSIARFQREISQRERLSSLGRLSTVIAHEVRNPLMIIKAALHTLRQEEVQPSVLREAAGDIDEEVTRLNRIVNDVLDFARPIRYELAAADLNALCRESAAAAQAAPGPSVQLDLDASLPQVTTDPERLRVALINLVVNARQAVDAQGPAEVWLSTRTAADGVTITIADNGLGISGADLPRVFDPYFTTKRGGTGLGLPIAKNIIEGLGGVITIASAPGRGTEMHIQLPFHVPENTFPGADAGGHTGPKGP